MAGLCRSAGTSFWWGRFLASDSASLASVSGGRWLFMRRFSRREGDFVLKPFNMISKRLEAKFLVLQSTEMHTLAAMWAVPLAGEVCPITTPEVASEAESGPW